MKRYDVLGEKFDFQEYEKGEVVFYDDFENLILAEIDKLKEYATFTDDYEKSEFTINILKNLLK